MSHNKCAQCGAPIDPQAVECKYCGEKFMLPPAPVYEASSSVSVSKHPMQQPFFWGPGVNPSWPIKNKLLAGILGIFLGGFGIHKFYMGKIGTGILYLLFSWTSIPTIIGFIEGVVYLASNDHNFQVKHKVRIR